MLCKLHVNFYPLPVMSAEKMSLVHMKVITLCFPPNLGSSCLKLSNFSMEVDKLKYSLIL